MSHIYVLHIPYKSIKYLAYMPSMVSMFVSSMYLAIMLEVCITFECVVSHICKNVESMCLFNILVVLLTYLMWQSYLFSNVCLEIVLYIELYIDICYTHLPLYKYLDSLPVYNNELHYGNVILLW